MTYEYHSYADKHTAIIFIFSIDKNTAILFSIDNNTLPYLSDKDTCKATSFKDTPPYFSDKA